MRVLLGVLVGVFGAVAGAAIGVALTYALLSGEEGVDAFTWLAVGVFFCFVAMPIGAVAAGLLCRQLFPGVFRYGIGTSVAYGIGASLVVMVVGLLAAVYYPTGDTDTPTHLLAGKLCGKPGIRYIGETTQGTRVCFTLTPDRSMWLEIGWRRPGPGRETTYYDWGDTLASPGQITEPGFTATIRGARASGVLGRFRWSARRAS